MMEENTTNMDQMNMQHGTHYNVPMPASPGQPMSEFNHHLAGAIIMLIGVAAILMYGWPRKFGFLKYVWPLSLLALGGYLIVYSDPAQWPSGDLSFPASMSDPETRQHKIYALLLILMGAIETTRALGLAKSDYWKYAFPALGAVGAIYLIFHKHESMPGMQMSSHELVLYQHIFYVIIGIAIVTTKVLYDMRKLRSRWAAYIWPTLAVILGLALVFYHE